MELSRACAIKNGGGCPPSFDYIRPRLEHGIYRGRLLFLTLIVAGLFDRAIPKSPRKP